MFGVCPFAAKLTASTLSKTGIKIAIERMILGIVTIETFYPLLQGLTRRSGMTIDLSQNDIPPCPTIEDSLV